MNFVSENLPRRGPVFPRIKNVSPSPAGDYGAPSPVSISARVRSNRKRTPDSFSGLKNGSKMICNMTILDNFFSKSIENRYVDRSVSIFEKKIMPDWFSGPKN